LCSTIDQVGSRLLFRGYGVSDSMKPVHAGLLGADCLILLDEAHLAEPFRQTLEWVRGYRGNAWRDAERGHGSPWSVAILTATPAVAGGSRFDLLEADRSDPVLGPRLTASKPARLIEAAKSGRTHDKDAGADSGAADRSDVGPLVSATVTTLERLQGGGVAQPAIGVVVNRVARARAVFSRLNDLFADKADVLLMIGPARAVERKELIGQLQPIRPGNGARRLERPLLVVATQCIEAGVDLDFDGLVSDAAPLSALRQRFGRLNRTGRPITPRAVIVALPEVLAPRYEDPVYGVAIKATWDYLMAHASVGDDGSPIFDFGVEPASRIEREAPPSPDVSVRPADAPVLLPAHLDLLAQTSPIPAVDPDVGLYLHGPHQQPDAVAVVWRADIVAPENIGKDDTSDAVRRLLLLVPPRASEAIALPVWAVRRWLRSVTRSTRDGATSELADVPGSDPRDDVPKRVARTPVAFRWRGDEEHSRWTDAESLRPGDTIVVPAIYGGVDRFGWDPDHRSAAGYAISATDVADSAASPFSGRRFAVRVAPGLIEDVSAEELAESIATGVSGRWQNRRDALLRLSLPEVLQEHLRRLDKARGGRVVVHDDLYGPDDDGRPRGVVFVAALGLKDEPPGEASVPTTEDDTAGSVGVECPLVEHNADVARHAAIFGQRCGLPADRVRDLEIAGSLHDLGKADSRWQRWIHGGDPLGPDPDDTRQILAKSARPVPVRTWEPAGLPFRWRHEALSVRLATLLDTFNDAPDPELVLWLIGTHHGYGRPFFPHADPDDSLLRALPSIVGLDGDLPPAPGPQSLAFDWKGIDWTGLGERVRQRYGLWELARLEATLRLADHRASEMPGRDFGERGGE
jgi:CRISPR-associated endonuclease/helicase Cas3